ncbi:colicin-like pore-forming protein [Rouxiella sp. T17]|uniref:colicin-like pore-forming protein n=1 Tax=Rouxiella sp. T17 TaxID=3085684 RepID=UPI002FC6E8E3
MTTPVAYYKEGIPYDATGQVIITITNGTTYAEGDGSLPTDGYGMSLVTAPNSVSQTIDPLAFAKNVASIHKQELGIAIEDTDQKQKELDQALTNAQQASAQKGKAYLSLLNATPAQRAQALFDYKTALATELQAKIASEQNAVTYIEQDIMLNNARIWWPESQADSDAAQQYINAREGDKNNVNQQIAEDQNQLSTVQSNTQSVQTETSQIQDAVKFTADFFKEVTANLSENASKTAQELANGAQGKKLRNAAEALAAYNRYQGNINSKFGVQDRQAIANALASLDQQALSQNLAKYSKGLSLLSVGLDAADLLQTLRTSLNSGDYNPFFVKVETLAAGALATELVAWTFAVMTGSVIGVLGFGLLMTLTGAMIDDELIGKVNDAIFN